MANLTPYVHPQIAARVAAARAAGVPDAAIAQYLGVTERELDRAYPRKEKTPGLSGPGVGALVLLIIIVALVASSSSSRR